MEIILGIFYIHNSLPGLTKTIWNMNVSCLFNRSFAFNFDNLNWSWRLNLIDIFEWPLDNKTTSAHLQFTYEVTLCLNTLAWFRVVFLDDLCLCFEEDIMPMDACFQATVYFVCLLWDWIVGKDFVCWDLLIFRNNLDLVKVQIMHLVDLLDNAFNKKWAHQLPY